MKAMSRRGEFDLIKRIKQGTKNDARVVLGIGDDTAVLCAPGNKEILFTTDMLIEDRHFRVKEATPYEIGRKALAVNLSDIAAMAGVPTHAVVAVGLPKKYTGRFLKDLNRGIQGLARQFHVNVVGGDTNRSEKVLLSVALLGEVEKGKALTRSGARVGDAVCVTGPLGGSYASKKHLNFIPRIEEARYLARHFHIHAMMDISDGLASDARRLCEASGVGIRLEEKAIPVSRHAKHVREALNEGEDFELLFTLSQKEVVRLPKHCSVIGSVTRESHGLKLLKQNGAVITLRGGFDHFQ